MIIDNRKDLNSLPIEILHLMVFIAYDQIGFDAQIYNASKTKLTEALRFDYPFDSEAITAYICEDPRQCPDVAWETAT